MSEKHSQKLLQKQRTKSLFLSKRPWKKYSENDSILPETPPGPPLEQDSKPGGVRGGQMPRTEKVAAKPIQKNHQNSTKKLRKK